MLLFRRDMRSFLLPSSSFPTRMLLSSRTVSNVVSYKLRSSLARALRVSHSSWWQLARACETVFVPSSLKTQSARARLLACSCDCTSFDDDDDDGYWQIIFFALFSGCIDFSKTFSSHFADQATVKTLRIVRIIDGRHSGEDSPQVIWLWRL